IDAALIYTTGANAASFCPATTRTKSVERMSDFMAAERNVPLASPCAWAFGGHGSRALSRPMRDDSPAARIRPAKVAACGMLRKIAESEKKVSDRESQPHDPQGPRSNWGFPLGPACP